MPLLLIALSFIVLMDNCSAAPVCSYSQTVSTISQYIGYYSTYSCSIMGNCSSRIHSITIYQTTYRQQWKCCTGYGPFPNCPPICSFSCGNNKQCIAPDTCTCESGWKGSNCSTAICNPPCSTNKWCIAPNTCECDIGWTDSNCLTPICSPPCGTNKQCTAPDNCTCASGWKGDNCLTPICSPPCGTNKQCAAPNNCTCVSAWTGSNCLTPICSPPCGTNKQCTAPNTCTCESGWTSSNCLIDINECSQNFRMCQVHCTNTIGSYYCSCDTSSVLAKNGIHCLGTIQDMTFSQLSSTRCLIKWNPPFQYMQYGSFNGYIVMCNILNTNTIITSNITQKLNVSVIFLKPFTSYICCVTPQWTTNEIGKTQCINFTTLEDAPDDSPVNVTVSVVNSSSLQIQWDPPVIPNGIITHYTLYINYSNGSEISTRTVDSQFRLYLLAGLMPYLQVGISISATTSRGEGPQSDYVYNTTEQTVPGTIQHLIVIVLSNSSVNISWQPPLLTNGVILHYYISIRSLTVNQSVIFETEENVYLIIHNLNPYTPYEVNVSAVTDAGIGEPLYKVFFTKEIVPRVAPNIELAQRVSPIEIIIKIKPLTLEEGRGIVTGYSFNLTKSIDHCVVVDMNKLLIHTLNTSIKVGNLDPLSKYCLSVSAQTKEGHGLESQNILIPVYDNKLIVMYINGLDNCYLWILNKTESILTEITQVIIRVLNKVCYCSITSDYLSDKTLQCDSEHTIQMRARLFVISNFTTSQLLTILQNWITNTSEITVDGQMLTVTSVYFLSNDTNPVLTSTSPNKTSNTENNIKNIAILFSAIGAAGGLSLFLNCVCCIIISVCVFMFKSQKNENFKPREQGKQENVDENKDQCYFARTTELSNKLYYPRDNNGISPNSIADSEDHYEYISNITVTKNSTKKSMNNLQSKTYEEIDDGKYEVIDVPQCYEELLSPKLGQGKLQESNSTSAASQVCDSPTLTKTTKTSTIENVQKQQISPVPPKKANKNVTSDVERFEMTYNYCYDKGTTAQKKPIPPPMKASKHGTSDLEHFKMENNHDYGIDITAQKEELPSVSSNDGTV